MIGNGYWNLGISLLAMGVTFMFAVDNNPIWTSLMRSLYSFVGLFLLVYVIRFFLGTVAGLSNPEESEEEVNAEEADEAGKGVHVDWSTPDEEGDPMEADASFSPLSPPKLATKTNLNPQELAQAVRHMSDDEGGETK